MAMKKTFGEMPAKTDQRLRQVNFPELAKMDTWTGDGRLLDAEGAGSRNLPLTLYAQFEQAPGHDGAVVVGSLDEITFDPDDRLVSGRGWLIATPEGEKMELLLATGALRGNSVDLAEAKVYLDLEEDDDGYFSIRARFTQWNIAATTFVGTPAFQTARGELSSEEITAALVNRDEPLDIQVESTYRILRNAPDITADLAGNPPWSDFHVPEPDHPQPIWVDENLRVYGHLGLWDTCHGGEEIACTTIPRPRDGYASFNQPGVLTDKGKVSTGPIFFNGGHPEVPDDDFHKAYGGTENAWADVRVVPGVFGPWVSGRVRPGVSDDVVYAARASRISGHWRRGELRAITSVNAEGFNVPGESAEIAAAFMVNIDDGEVVDLVASFPACSTPVDEDLRQPFAEQVSAGLERRRTKASVVGRTDLPIHSDRGRSWDGPAARSRVLEWATSEGGEVDPDKMRQAFLWRDDDADPATSSAYKLGFADVVEGELRIIAAGVFATAGGRGVNSADIPESSKGRVRTKICSLYDRLADFFDDDDIECPFTANNGAALGGMTAEVNDGLSLEDEAELLRLTVDDL